MSLITGVHHVGFSVPNLDEALQFFTEVLGFELLSHGALPTPDDPIAEQFDVEPDESVRFAFLKAGGDTIELVEWTSPRQQRQMPRNPDWGGRHLALKTGGLEQTLARLRTVPGVRILKPRGERFVYVQTPFGMYLQLMAPNA
ncbi:VOC family protein [Calidithermus timidus]|jgi:catechol 2,3-dioxygenase-like lactoylglutathione lyase family enzyme|uniref:VOC family protein n=1 Tax=Calidithermus timidus TaxID=307124 RepID=UPI00037A0994|nr:VOC family protein [Calidithermus timidus]